MDLVVAFGSRKACSLTEAVLKNGDCIVATARRPEQLDDLIKQYPDTIKTVRLDVTNLQEVQAAIESALTAKPHSITSVIAQYDCMNAYHLI